MASAPFGHHPPACTTMTSTFVNVSIPLRIYLPPPPKKSTYYKDFLITTIALNNPISPSVAAVVASSSPAIPVMADVVPTSPEDLIDVVSVDGSETLFASPNQQLVALRDFLQAPEPHELVLFAMVQQHAAVQLLPVPNVAVLQARPNLEEEKHQKAMKKVVAMLDASVDQPVQIRGVPSPKVDQPDCAKADEEMLYAGRRRLVRKGNNNVRAKKIKLEKSSLANPVPKPVPVQEELIMDVPLKFREVPPMSHGCKNKRKTVMAETVAKKHANFGLKAVNAVSVQMLNVPEANRVGSPLPAGSDEEDGREAAAEVFEEIEGYTWNPSQYKQGSSLIVYMGVYAPLNVPVAIKSQRRLKSKTKQAIDREIDLLKQLLHPAFVQHFQLLPQASRSLNVVELFPHQTLGEFLAQNGLLAEPRSFELITQVIDGIDYLHNSGHIHRNLNLDAIWLGDGDHLKIGQLTMAANVDPPKKMKLEEMKNLAFLAPEVLSGMHYLQQADVWSVGIILYNMLYNTTPFSGETADEILSSIDGGLHPLGLSPQTEGLLFLLCAPNDADRPLLKTLKLQKEYFGSYTKNFEKVKAISTVRGKVSGIDEGILRKTAEFLEIAPQKIEEAIKKNSYNELHSVYLMFKKVEAMAAEQQ